MKSNYNYEIDFNDNNVEIIYILDDVQNRFVKFENSHPRQYFVDMEVNISHDNVLTYGEDYRDDDDYDDRYYGDDRVSVNREDESVSSIDTKRYCKQINTKTTRYLVARHIKRYYYQKDIIPEIKTESESESEDSVKNLFAAAVGDQLLQNASEQEIGPFDTVLKSIMEW